MGRIKMVATDLDHTLLHNNMASPEVIQMLQRLEQAGIHVVFSSGRIPESLFFLSKLWGVRPHISALNGAYVQTNKGELLSQKPIDQGILTQVIFLLRREGLYFHMYSTRDYYSEKYNPKVLEHLFDPKQTDKTQVNVHILKDILKDLSKNIAIYKILTLPKKEKTKEKVIKALEDLSVSVTQSGHDNLEINAKNCNKRTGLKALMEKLDISSDELVCIGDFLNDIPMLEMTKHSFAMGNAPDKVKKVACYTTGPVQEDGFVLAMEELIQNGWLLC